MSDMMRILCPRCHTINRLPAARLADGPKCGQCHEQLFTGHPIVLTVADFDLHTTRNDIPLVVDFWAPWCGPCRMMAPAYEQAAKMLEPQVRLAKVNTEEQQALGVRFGIQSIPTVMLLRGGREVARQSGALGSQEIVQWVRARL
jgi:thioredoxin 2